MKKFIAIVMVAMFALSMVACSQPAADDPRNRGDSRNRRDRCS